ncbi:MAG: pyruvate dehydrogenase (acetyl-transferring) E1 component subunit alpha [Haloferacaceae archaeon]
MSLLQRDPDDRIRVLDEEGSVVGEVPDLDDEELVGMYREMRLARTFDRRAVSLQRQGRMGTYPPLSGQEAAQVGSAHALAERDWLFPSYREHAASRIHGVPLARILQYWMGDERGNRRGEENVFPVAVPIATQIPHAVGLSWAAKLDGDRTVALVNFGDGATSEGDFHEGLNFAGVFDTPTVFLCNNNQWAISMPRAHQTASDTIAEKARAYGFTGVQVDGMDPLAVYAATEAAVEKARTPADDEARPTLLEAEMYRFGAHTTADDPTVYRDDEEVERWKQLDPIPRLEQFLRGTGRLDDERVDAIDVEVEATVRDAVEAAESTPRPEPGEMFDHAYAAPSPALQEQRAALERLREERGDDAIRRD